MIQVSAREVVSDPAKKKVLTLDRRSLSEIRWSGDVPSDKFDLTEGVLGAIKCITIVRTKQAEEVNPIVSRAVLFTFENPLRFLLYDLATDSVDDFL
jgi:hypothetical protein